MATKKQKRHLERLAVEPFYYYETEAVVGIPAASAIPKHPLAISVCLLRRGEEVLARGVAVCSPSDRFVKKVGRARALGMALRAVMREESSEEMHPRRFVWGKGIHPLWKAEGFGHRSAFRPTLTELEVWLCAKRAKRE